jgi:uncharacterized CHY-type Zn-finger protein
MPYNYKKYYTCKKCLEIIENPPLKPRPNICAFHPIGVNKISTEKTADSETNICESCINKTKRCKKCGLPLYYHEDLELNKDVLCYGCRKSLKWWELLKYPKIG